MYLLIACAVVITLACFAVVTTAVILYPPKVPGEARE